MMMRKRVFNELLAFQRKPQKVAYERIAKESGAAPAGRLRRILGNLRLLDAYLESVSNRPIAKIDPPILALLATSAQTIAS